VIINRLEIGKRYKLPHGFGKLLGHETQDPYKPGFMKFYPTLPQHDSPSMRYIFDIEDCEWLTIMTDGGYGPRYAAWGTQIEEVPE
jgi:hypothetical protein